MISKIGETEKKYSRFDDTGYIIGVHDVKVLLICKTSTLGSIMGN